MIILWFEIPFKVYTGDCIIRVYDVLFLNWKFNQCSSMAQQQMTPYTWITITM